jgi:two-component system response regulator HydG
MKTLLVVDDDAIERKLLQTLLGKVGGYHVVTAEDGASAIAQAAKVSPQTVILDMNLPDMNGLEILHKLKLSHPQVPIIMLTGVTDLQTAVKAIQQGAHNYLTKPFENDQMMIAVQNAVEKNELLTEMKRLRQKAGNSPALGRILGKSQAVQDLIGQIQKVADSQFTVLIQGETGTGKELAARALHEESGRRHNPFVAIDCGAISENLLESELFGHEKGAFSGADRKKEGQLVLANGGTLFLDEVGNLPLGLQSKLLRVLQERQVRPVGANQSQTIDVRFIAATNVPLEEEAKAGKFRQDLYYRLAEFTLHLPALKDRREDIPILAKRFREEACVELKRTVSSISDEASKLLLNHAWPGNIRELRNVIRQAVLTTPDFEIHADQIKHLLKSSKSTEAPSLVEMAVPAGLSLKKIGVSAVEEAEKQAIRNVLRSTQGNKSQAAKILKTDYKTLHVKIKKYGLQA